MMFLFNLQIRIAYILWFNGIFLYCSQLVDLVKAFNNLERWNHLKDVITHTPDLYSRIQNIWKTHASYFFKEHKTGLDISNIVERINSGSNRVIYRIGAGASCQVKLDGREIILAVKLPSHIGAVCDFGSYKSQRQLDASKNLYAYNPLNIESMTFEKLAAEGKNVPWVTGIVAGYGLLGTLTEDVTEGGICEITQRGSSTAVVKRYPDGRMEEVSVDWKYLGSTLGVTTNYFSSRLQIDRSISKRRKK